MVKDKEIQELEGQLQEAKKKKTLEKKVDVKKDKPKGFFGNLFKTTQLKKPEKVAVILLKKNNTGKEMILEPDNEGVFNINGKKYHQDEDCIYTMEIDKVRYPLAIIPEWSMIPLGTQKWDERPMVEKFAKLQDHVLRGIKNAELVRMGDKENKTKLSTKQIVLGVIVAIILIGIFIGMR